MSYIIKHDFDQSTPYYVRVVDERNFEETYNPNFATVFTSKKDAKEWINTYSSMKDYSKVVELQSAAQKYKVWCEKGMVRRKLNCIDQVKSRPYKGENYEQVIDWWVNYHKLVDERKIKYDHYKTWPNLYEVTQHLHDIECYHSHEYNQKFMTFSIYTKSTGKFDDFKAELDLVLEKITYKDDEGYLILPIFDHFISEHGNNVSLLIHPETEKIKIGKGYSWDRNFNSLESAFEYMKKERYYD